MKYYLAIDIGNRVGRHVIGYEDNGKLVTDEVYSFENAISSTDGRRVWNVDGLVEEVISGISSAFAKYPEIESLAIDTWGEDYVLMSENEEIFPVYAYSDARGEDVADEVNSIVSRETVYEHTGIALTPHSSLYQLYDDKLSGRLDDATDFLMMSEYLAYKLTGVKLKEYTGATATGLVNTDTFRYDRKIWSLLGLPIALDSKIAMPGTLVGKLKGDIAKRVGGETNVVLAASRNTASAVEAIKAEENLPYIISADTSVIGVKTATVIIDEKSLDSGFSNEGGVGYNAYQKTVTGAWIVNKLCEEICPDASFEDTVKMAKGSGYFELIDVNDKSFSCAESIKDAIDAYMAKNGKSALGTVGDYIKCVYASLAHCYGVSVAELEHNTGKVYGKIYVVGSGAKNTYLNALTEKYTGKRVIALPIEAAALGNLQIQMKRK